MLDLTACCAHATGLLPPARLNRLRSPRPTQALWWFHRFPLRLALTASGTLQLAVCVQDTAWLDIYLSEIPHVVYQVDDWDKTEGAQHRTLVNKGNEAMAYLQFILDYWGRLPACTVFLHGHRCAFMHSSEPEASPTAPCKVPLL